MNSKNTTVKCDSIPEYTDGYILFCVSYAGAVLFINILCMGLWIRYNSPQYPSLQQRSTFQTLIFSMTWVLYLFVSTGYRLDPSTDELVSCFTFNLMYCLSLAIPLGIQLFRVWRWFLQLEYNTLSFKVFEEESENFYSHQNRHWRFSKRSKESLIFPKLSDDAKQLEKYRKKLSKRRTNFMLIIIILFSIAIFSILATLSCKMGHGCGILSPRVALINDILFSSYGFGALMTVISVHRMTKSLPDPYNYMRDIKLAIGLPLVFGCLYIAVMTSHPQSNAEKVYPISPALLPDFGIYCCYFIVIVLPLKVLFPCLKLSDPNNVSMEAFLQSENGLRLFKSYMVCELSVENLNFYLAATKWKENFHNFENSANLESARTIANEWLPDPENKDYSSQQYVNVGYKVVCDIRAQLKLDIVEESIFDPVVNEVYNLMWTNSFARFKNTQKYRQFLGTQYDIEHSAASL
eukprot:snap_masked-scaffold_14-processed-gene-1.17-mRNA-1 protein AED:1.00 eAED:1.00 QI:0/-1/0/0/-1/1/1/0/463